MDKEIADKDVAKEMTDEIVETKFDSENTRSDTDKKEVIEGKADMTMSSIIPTSRWQTALCQDKFPVEGGEHNAGERFLAQGIKQESDSSHKVDRL